MVLVLCAQRAGASCPDYPLTQAELTQIFDSTLGGARAFVLGRRVVVDARNAACYLRMQLDVGIGGQKLCTASACTVGVFDGSRLGVRAFSIAGCDQVFAIGGMSRRVGTAWTDITDRMRLHCGSDRFRISGMVAEGPAQGGTVRLSFEPLP